jgi:hypothetical protein
MNKIICILAAFVFIIGCSSSTVDVYIQWNASGKNSDLVIYEDKAINHIVLQQTNRDTITAKDGADLHSEYYYNGYVRSSDVTAKDQLIWNIP